MMRRHSTLNRDPNTLLRNWSKREIRLRNGRVLPAPSEQSKQIAIEFVNWLRTRGDYADNSVFRYLITLRKIISWAELWEKTIFDLDYGDFIRIVNELHESDIQVVIKVILKFLYDKTEDIKFKRIYDKIKVTKKKRRMVDILNEEQIRSLIEACARIDYEMKVLVEVVYETGARVGEILSLTAKDVEFDEYGAKIYIRRSKSEFRAVRVILYANDLLKLCDGLRLEDMVFKHEYKYYLRKLSEAWKMAGLPREVRRKFHVLRHTRATELLRRRVLSEKEMMLWFGWKTRGMLDVYAHITMSDVEERYLSALIPNINNN